MYGSERSRSFRADPAQLQTVRRFLSESAHRAGLSDRLADDIVLAANEAATNAIVHSGSARVYIGWRALEDRVEVEIRDEGLFDRRIHMDRLEGTGGLGIPLMMSLTDAFELQEGTPRRPGTIARLMKLRPT